MPAERWALLALGAVLAASCAKAAVTLPSGVEFRPAPLSALSTRRDLRFVTARWPEGGQIVTVLAHQPEGGTPLPVARLLQQGQDSDARAVIQRLSPRDGGPLPAHLELAVVEQLYSMVFRLSPLARYCLGSIHDEAPPPCDDAAAGVSQARVLQALAGQRERASAHTPAAVPWRLVEIGPAPRGSADLDTVSVRAVVQGGPAEQLPIYFNRAPHSICSARTDAEGRATCRLEDQHGDGDQHDHATTVVASFPGELRPDRVLLPTTWVLPRLPTFARPLALPGLPLQRP